MMSPEFATIFADQVKVNLRLLTEDGDFTSWLVTPKEDGSTIPDKVGCRFM